MKIPLWYCITPNDAVEMLHDGQSIVFEDHPDLAGKILDARIENGFIRFGIQHKSGFATFFHIPLAKLIFKTNERCLEITRPGRDYYIVTF